MQTAGYHAAKISHVLRTSLVFRTASRSICTAQKDSVQSQGSFTAHAITSVVYTAYAQTRACPLQILQSSSLRAMTQFALSASMRRYSSSACIVADFHRATVATAPGEKLLIGRRPVRNCTQLQLFFFVSLAISDTDLTGGAYSAPQTL